MYGDFGDNVRVQTVAEINGVNIVAKRRKEHRSASSSINADKGKLWSRARV